MHMLGIVITVHLPVTIKQMKKENLFIVILFLSINIACSHKPSTSVKNHENLPTMVTHESSEPDQKINTLSIEEKSEGWNLLFDGSSTTGWHSYLNNEVEGWQVKDGLLFTPGNQNDIVTDKEYKNFNLVVEWRIEEKGNSGIFYYVVEDPAYNRISHTGPEFQIIDDENYPQELADNQKTGANSDVKAPTVLASKAPGEWNHTRIIANKGNVEHWLNGKKVVEFNMDSHEWKNLVAKSKFAALDYAKVRKGRIGLQDHGGPAAFRNVKIREL